ncbi:hypothetical protein C0584_01175 [Candidatus Parcubacteria bacterium]|nr:MAG: hypothetical protein C0584_01175 [Candidatus Parcubacteria bacterium]
MKSFTPASLHKFLKTDRIPKIESILIITGKGVKLNPEEARKIKRRVGLLVTTDTPNRSTKERSFDLVLEYNGRQFTLTEDSSETKTEQKIAI